jgi:hypothetical protein
MSEQPQGKWIASVVEGTPDTLWVIVGHGRDVQPKQAAIAEWIAVGPADGAVMLSEAYRMVLAREALAGRVDATDAPRPTFGRVTLAVDDCAELMQDAMPRVGLPARSGGEPGPALTVAELLAAVTQRSGGKRVGLTVRSLLEEDLEAGRDDH